MLDTQERIKGEYYEYKKIKFSTSLPLFHLIIYMVECGMSVKEIVEDTKMQIISQSKDEMIKLCSEYMKLTYPFYTIIKKREFKYFSYGSLYFSISVEKKNDIITEISVKPADTWNNPNLVRIDSIDIEDTVCQCLFDFYVCINLAALSNNNKDDTSQS